MQSTRTNVNRTVVVKIIIIFVQDFTQKKSWKRSSHLEKTPKLGLLIQIYLFKGYFCRFFLFLRLLIVSNIEWNKTTLICVNLQRIRKTTTKNDRRTWTFWTSWTENMHFLFFPTTITLVNTILLHRREHMFLNQFLILISNLILFFNFVA